MLFQGRIGRSLRDICFLLRIKNLDHLLILQRCLGLVERYHFLIVLLIILTSVLQVGSSELELALETGEHVVTFATSDDHVLMRGRG